MLEECGRTFVFAGTRHPDDRPLVEWALHLAEQVTDERAERGLVPDDQRCPGGGRPAGNREHVGDRCARRERRLDLVVSVQCLHRLPSAHGRRDDDSAILRQARHEPARHSPRFIMASRRQWPKRVGHASHGIAVTPQDQVHPPLRSDRRFDIGVVLAL